jgi:large subunit ribosomal protein L12
MEYVYAALLLHKTGKPVDEVGIKKVIEATGSEVNEGKMKTLIASLKDVDIDKELENAQVASVAPAVSGGEGGDGKEKADEKKEEVKTEAAAEGLSALFG